MHLIEFDAESFTSRSEPSMCLFDTVLLDLFLTPLIERFMLFKLPLIEAGKFWIVRYQREGAPHADPIFTNILAQVRSLNHRFPQAMCGWTALLKKT